MADASPEGAITNASIPQSQLEQKSSELVEALLKISKSSPKLVKSTPHEVESIGPNGQKTTRTIQSWKMNEFKYSVYPSPFPTLARGLFTEWVPTSPSKISSKAGDGPGLHRVVARGYDKFFNMNEVPWNNWQSLATHTEAPYYLTIKSNGCIIFMAALSLTEVLVMSKHSLGSVNGLEVSHAQKGEEWMERHLETKGRTQADFAKWLWDENATAVAELCDDSFEEHVLPYSKEHTGLHLHGINRNQGAFETFSPEQVNACANEWGFIPTEYITLQSTKEVKDFTDKIGDTGKWNGIAVEGFVVRTKVAAYSKKNEKGEGSSRDAPPYPPGSDFFFKIKFDEPYMTYRDWREMTKTIIAARSKGNTPSIAKSKLRRPESFAYRTWVTKEIEADPAAFAEFGHGKGIIAARDKFLKWLESKEGKSNLDKNMEEHGGADSVIAPGAETWDRVVIVPIAVPGCGKTVIGLALQDLFGFGHTQSDNITTKKTAPAFMRNIVQELHAHKVVYADRNNHLSQHREGIRTAVKSLKGRHVKLLGLNWDLSHLPHATVHRICSDRVYGRGENHQTLVGDSSRTHEDIIWKFIADTEDLGLGEVDKVVEMSVEDTPEEGVRRVIDVLVPLLGLDRPSDEKIKEACDAALAYTPKVKKDPKSAKPQFTARYYGLVPEVDLTEAINDAIQSAEIAIPQAFLDFWEKLRADGRVTKRAHITIAHRNNLPDDQELWDRCQALAAVLPSPLFRIRLSEVITDGQVMAVVVEELEVVDDGAVEAQDFLSNLPQDLRGRLHITVGTADSSVSPYMAKELVEKWKADESTTKVHVVALEALKVQGQIRGLS